MPTYDWKCKKCQHEWEQFHKSLKNLEKPKCPKCGGDVERAYKAGGSIDIRIH